MKTEPRKSADLLSEIKDMYDGLSSEYDNQESHVLCESERDAWKTKVFSKYLKTEKNHILDVGSGTGLLTRFIAELQLSKEVTGLECAEDMIEQARQHGDSINYIIGDTHEVDTFRPETFDCIVSRQVACHFYDPLVVFENWHTWLQSGGCVVVVDGLWFREGWSNDDLIDRLPLSCVQTRATLSYLLQKSRFEIVESDFFDSERKKYFVVARKR